MCTHVYIHVSNVRGCVSMYITHTHYIHVHTTVVHGAHTISIVFMCMTSVYITCIHMQHTTLSLCHNATHTSRDPILPGIEI